MTAASIKLLSMAELDMVGGGADPNYHLCSNGTEAGGGPGLYPPVRRVQGVTGMAD